MQEARIPLPSKEATSYSHVWKSQEKLSIDFPFSIDPFLVFKFLLPEFLHSGLEMMVSWSSNTRFSSLISEFPSARIPLQIMPAEGRFFLLISKVLFRLSCTL